MKFFQKAPDGGKDSGVTGFFIVEIKPLFSIVLLHFRNGSREAYHSHAFNAVTLWLKGRVIEHRLLNGWFVWNFSERFQPQVESTEYRAGQFKFTGRSNTHKVESIGESWALSFRGPWKDTWREFKAGRFITLTHGRKVVG